MAKYYDLNIPGSEVQRRLDLASHNVLAFDGILDVPVTASDELITSAESYQILYAPNGGRGEMLMSIGGTYYRNFRLQSSGKTYLDSSWYNEDGQIRKDRLFLNGAARDIYAYAAGSFGKVERDGVDGITPHIDPTTKHWMLGDQDTGIVAEGQDGQDGTDGIDGTDGKSAFDIWLENGHSGNISDFLAWMKDTSSMIGPKFATTTADCLMVNDTATLYYVPNGSTFNVYMADSGGQGVNAHSLATGVPGDITNYAGIYDVSADHNDTQYSPISAALAVIPTTAQKGGMTIKYIDSESGKYVQYMLTKSTFSTDESDWERVSLDDIRDSIKSILGGEKDVDVEVVNGGDNVVVLNKYTNLLNTANDTTFYSNYPSGNSNGFKAYRIKVTTGERYKIKGIGAANNYYGMYLLTGDENVVLDHNYSSTDGRTTPIKIDITQNGWLYVNLSSFSSANGDGVFKIEKQQVTGLLDEKVSDAPNDGKEYIRKDNNWVKAGTEQVRNDLNGYDEESYDKIGTVTSNAGINLLKKSVGETFSGIIATGSAWTGFGGCIIDVQAGDILQIKGKGLWDESKGLYILTGNNNVVKATYYNEVDSRENPIPLEITENGKLYVNFYEYDSSKDGVFKKGTSHVDGIKDRVLALEEAMSDDEESPIEALVKEVDGYYVDEEVKQSRFYQDDKHYFNFGSVAVGGSYPVGTEPNNYSVGTNAAYKLQVKDGDRIKIVGVGVGSGSNGFYLLTDSEGIVIDNEYYPITARGDNPKSLTIAQDGFLYVNLNTPLENDGVFKIVKTKVPGLSARVETLENADKKTIKVCLPNTIYAVVGDTLQVFYRSIIQAVNPYNYNIHVTCAKGKIYPRYFEYIPTSDDIGTTKLTVRVRDDWGNIIGSAECNIVTKAAVKAPTSNLNVAIFGDSLTYPRKWVKEAYRRLTDTGGSPVANGFANISFVGLQYTPNGSSNAKYCAYGGWHWGDYTTAGRLAYRFSVSGVSTLAIGATYSNNNNTFTIVEINVTDGTGSIRCTVANSNAPAASGTLIKTSGEGDASIAFTASSQDAGNPLWNDNKIDFANYAEQVANGEDIDVVYTLLTWNGWGGRQTNFDSVLAQVKAFTDALHTDFPNAKLKLMGIQLPSLNGGMGSNYTPNDAYSNTYNMVVTAQNVNMAYKEFAESEEYSGFVEYVDVASQFDSENNMQTFNNKNVNTRSTKKEWIGSNGVHPDETGYAQIADVFYRNFICNFCQ